MGCVLSIPPAPGLHTLLREGPPSLVTKAKQVWVLQPSKDLLCDLCAFSRPPIHSGRKFYTTVYYLTESIGGGEVEKEKEGTAEDASRADEAGLPWWSSG